MFLFKASTLTTLARHFAPEMYSSVATSVDLALQHNNFGILTHRIGRKLKVSQSTKRF